MTSNAQWRQDVRTKNVTKYRHEDKLDDLDRESGHAGAKEAIKYVIPSKL